MMDGQFCLLRIRLGTEQFASPIADDKQDGTQQPSARVGKGYKETTAAENRGHIQIELAEKDKTEQHNDRRRG